MSSPGGDTAEFIYGLSALESLRPLDRAFKEEEVKIILSDYLSTRLHFYFHTDEVALRSIQDATGNVSNLWICVNDLCVCVFVHFSTQTNKSNTSNNGTKYHKKGIEKPLFPKNKGEAELVTRLSASPHHMGCIHLRSLLTNPAYGVRSLLVAHVGT